MPNYSYKVRVLAAFDSIAPGPVELGVIENEVKATSEANGTPLPHTWKKWMKKTLDKLVEERWLLNEGQEYTASLQLRNRIKEEKARLDVPIDNHEWKLFAVIARRLPNKATDTPSAPQTPAIRTPPTRASKRKSLAVAVEVPRGGIYEGNENQENNETIFVRDDGRPDKESKRRRLRYSDPGVTSSQTSSQRRKSLSRRKSVGTSRTNRRHTMAVPPQSPHMQEIAQGVSREIQFIPLRQALSARTRRALRRNQLSEEMNDIDEERRALQRKNREELSRVRAELERGRQLIEELQRQLHATRMAPPSETGSIGPGSVGMAPIYEADAEEAFSPPAFGSSSAPRTPFRFNMGSALTPALRRFQNENQREPGETPISRRDKKIKALEGQIEQLRQDILDREEEEKRRAEEEEIYHEAEEQILMEAKDMSQADMSSMTPGDISVSEICEEPITPSTRRSRIRVSFADEEEEFTPMISADSDDEDEFQAPIGDYSLDQEVQGPSTPIPATEITQAITVTTISAAPEIEQENETLKAAIDVLKQRVEGLEEELKNTKTRPEARASGVQTDLVVDTEKVKLKEMIEALEDKAEVLEQSSLEERGRLWQKIRGHISEAHNYEGVEELDMAIDEILTNLALAQNTADEHHKAFEAADRDLRVERMLAEEKAKEKAEEKAAEIVELEAERDSLLEQVEKLEEIKSDLEGQMADHEADEERLERELEDHRKELAAEQKELEMKSNELEAAVAEADKLERDLAELGDVIDKEIAGFSNPPRGPLTTILEKLQVYAEVVKEERETQQAKLEELMKSIAEKEDLLGDIRAQLASLTEKYDELEQINEKQQALLEKKDQEIEELQEGLASIKMQLEEAQKTNVMLDGVIASKNEKITSLTDQLTWATADLANIKEKREEAQRQVAELLGELEKKNEEVDKLDLDLSSKDQMITSLEVQLVSVTERLSALDEKHTSKEQKVLELSNELLRVKEEAKAQLEELNVELDAKSGKIFELQEGMDTLTKQVAELQTTIEQFNKEQGSKEAKINELKDQVKQKLKAIAELETLNDVIQLKDKVLEEMEARVTRLGADLDEKDRLLASASASLAALRVEVANKNVSIESLEHDLKLLKNSENELSAALADKDGKMDELSEEINEVNNTFAEKSHQVEDLKAEISSSNKAIEVKEEQTRALQGEIDNLNYRLESYAAKIQKLEEDVAILQRANEQKEITIQELNGTIANLNKTIAERDDATATLTRAAQEKEELIITLNEDIIELNEQISSLSDDLISIQSQRDIADGKIKELMESVAQKDERIAELEKLYDVIATKNTEIDSLNDTIDDLRIQLSDLNERYAAAEARVEELVEEVARKQRTITQLEADLNSSTLRETETNKRYMDAIIVQDTLKEELERMQSAVDDLKAALDGKDEEIAALQQKCTDLETRMREQIVNHSEHLKDLRAQLERERNEAVDVLHLKLQEALNCKAELEADLQATMSEYKEIVIELKSKIEGLEGEVEGLKGKNEQTSVEMKRLEGAKDAIIAELEETVREVAQAKDKSEAELEEQIEQKRMALAEKEKELADIELAAQKEKHALRIELNKQYEEISRFQDKITQLEIQLEESVEEENRLEEEILEYEQSTQLLKEDAAKIKAALESNNQELAKEIDALRFELLRARDELKQEIELHANNIEEKDSKIAELTKIIDDYKEEGASLKKRISALNVTNEKWRQKYNRAIEDSTAEFDTIQNNLWKIASGVKERKAQFLQRSTDRLLAQEGEQEEDEHDQLQIEGTHEGASTAGGLMSPDATTNVSFMSPPTPESTQHFAPLSSRIISLTTHAGKKRRFDSGIGVDEEEEDEVARFEEYGSQRRGFLA
ncbi:hypothetical protein BGX38DRAFT_1201154 [Terfezia claveryi]|nr:hypothetical protein BGX38DRAFT_1201154 [Terfezia claveryi]